jgi:hypothetical protein
VIRIAVVIVAVLVLFWLSPLGTIAAGERGVQNVGLQFRDQILDPAMQEAIKASTAKFTAEDLITKREMVRDEIKAQLKGRLRTGISWSTSSTSSILNFPKISTKRSKPR